MNLIADISSGNTGFGDVMYLVAFILFVLAVVVHLTHAIDVAYTGLLVAAGLAATALGLLVQ